MISNLFFKELLASCFVHEEIFKEFRSKILSKDLPSQEYSKVWRYINTYYDAYEKLPSVGKVSQKYIDEDNIQQLLTQIDFTTIPAKVDLVESIAEYINRTKARNFYGKYKELFERGDDDGLHKLVKEFSDDITNTHKEEVKFSEVFSDFQPRMIQRLSEDHEIKKIPFNIAPLDVISEGGIDRGDIALFLAQSGIGKSKLLKWIGLNAARDGLNVLHFQAEGTRRECEDGYDGTFTGIKLAAADSFTDEVHAKLPQWFSEASRINGEVSIVAFENFFSGSVSQMHKYCGLYKKKKGYFPDLIIADYLDELNPDESYTRNLQFERMRREDVAHMLKNLAVYCGCAIVTATQASHVTKEELESQDFVMTRSNIAESKGLIRPFSYFFTMNQTSDERSNNEMRIHCDKIRNYKHRGLARIVVDYDHDRFYDQAKTMHRFGYIEE